MRAHFRRLRKAISPVDRQLAAQQAAKHFVMHPLFVSSQHIACYATYEDEFDTQPMIQVIQQAEKQCYLPMLTPSQSLQFAAYEQGDVLVPNQYNILEPVHTQIIDPNKLEIVIVPLIAYDLEGNRLGTGGGYYDRTFAFKQKNEPPFLLGLGYAAQCAAHLPFAMWDVALDGVITENGVFMFNK